VEIFHLTFLRLLSSGPDRSLFVVKGGCNLRFWLGSVRLSEDLDLDVAVTAKGTLRHKVDRILDGGPMRSLLGGSGLSLEGHTAPKQTETTQRWKIALRAEGSDRSLHTKIEFSRRAGAIAGSAYEPVDRAIARRYGLTPPLCEHYLAPAAIAQKIGALAHRAETQARDVFDLGHLFLRAGAAPLALDAAALADVERAIERTMSVSYDDFAGQVLAFLEDEHRALFEDRASFEGLQAEVVARLEELRG
jgi:hypothetical protein